MATYKSTPFMLAAIFLWVVLVMLPQGEGMAKGNRYCPRGHSTRFSGSCSSDVECKTECLPLAQVTGATQSHVSESGCVHRSGKRTCLCCLSIEVPQAVSCARTIVIPDTESPGNPGCRYVLDTN